MKLRMAVYNVEWMRDLFNKNGTPITFGEAFQRGKALAKVLNTINADFIGIVEGPDTLKDNTRNAVDQLEKWISDPEFEFDDKFKNFKAVTGYTSPGVQELCAIYDSSKIQVSWTPVQDGDDRFDFPFLIDTMNDLIQEQYMHFRPPLELTIKNLSNEEFAKVIVAHTKSKGIFSPVDYARFELISERDRLRLFAECLSIRKRADQFLKSGSEVIVMGDINDGIGQDFYENRFNKSAAELLLGDVWEPSLILKSVLEKPKWGKNGWKPSSARFRDRITEDFVNVLIDHILVSKNFKVNSSKIWNPFENKDDAEIIAIEEELIKASDHFPVVVDLERCDLPG